MAVIAVLVDDDEGFCECLMAVVKDVTDVCVVGWRQRLMRLWL